MKGSRNSRCRAPTSTSTRKSKPGRRRFHKEKTACFCAPIRKVGDAGTCFALSVLWCNLAANPSLTPQRRVSMLDYIRARQLFTISMGAVEEDLIEAAMSGKGYVPSGGGSEQVNTVLKFDKIAPFLPNLSGAHLLLKIDHWDLGSLLAAFFGAPAGRRKLILINVHGDGWGHSTAMCDAGDNVGFYEPNAGEYRMRRVHIEGFIRAWVPDTNEAFGKPPVLKLKDCTLVQMLDRHVVGRDRARAMV